MPECSAQTRLLVVAPHPDDETIATGLLIQQVLAAGGEVRILLLTAGDNNPWPQRWLERRLRIRDVDRQRWGHRRHAEMLQALQCLGVPAESLQSLGWPDMGVTAGLLQAPGTFASVLAPAIGQFRPTLIALPALADRHPDHGSAHVAVRLAMAEQGHSPRMLAYLVHGHGDGTSMEIRGTAAQMANKRAALAAHRSQMALSGRRMRRLAARPECYVEVSSTASTESTTLPWKPPVWLQPWLRLGVAGPTQTHCWHWRDAPLQRDADGRFRLSAEVGVAEYPCFVRLSLSLPSPWIFDHWGWHELGTVRRVADAGLAQAG